LVLLVAALVLVVAVSSSSSSSSSEDRWAITPSGIRPSSCVFGPIPLNQVVVNFGTHSEIQDEEGNSLQVIGSCDHSKITKGAALPPDGWAAYVWAQSTTPTITAYNGTWSVPVNPKDKGAQTLFLFTGLQDEYGLDRDASAVNIIQPVLQFGPSEAGGGPYWAMASWYVDSNDNAFFSDLTKTTSGHNIQGNMVRNNANKVWTIQTIDTNTNDITTLNIATNTTEPYAFVTLEVYTVSNCGEYPTGTDTFTDLKFRPASSPTWTSVTAPGCNEGVKINSPTSISIDF